MRAVRWVLFFVAGLVVLGILARKAGSGEQPPVVAASKPTSASQPTPTATREQQDQVTTRDVVALLDDVDDLFARAREMDNARKAGDDQRCIELMHDLLPKAEALSVEASQLPLEFADLGVAASHMTQCVTCNHENARLNCRLAGQSLGRAREQVRRN